MIFVVLIGMALLFGDTLEIPCPIGPPGCVVVQGRPTQTFQRMPPGCNLNALIAEMEAVLPYARGFDANMTVTLEFRSPQQRLRDSADAMDRKEASVQKLVETLTACKATK